MATKKTTPATDDTTPEQEPDDTTVEGSPVAPDTSADDVKKLKKRVKALEQTVADQAAAIADLVPKVRHLIVSHTGSDTL